MLSILKKLFSKNSPDLQQVIDRGAVVIDVRTPGEYKQGHLNGSKNIPLNEIKLKAATIKKWGKPVITVCRSGSRSQMARNTLMSVGVETYNGGSWTNLKKILGQA